jgi:hypothetical protein
MRGARGSMYGIEYGNIRAGAHVSASNLRIYLLPPSDGDLMPALLQTQQRRQRFPRGQIPRSVVRHPHHHHARAVVRASSDDT